MSRRQFTREELYQYDGRNGAPALIAYQRKVYDVSQSFLWRNGRHQVIHLAGTDLTGALAPAPHGIDLLEKFPIVGVLVKDEELSR